MPAIDHSLQVIFNMLNNIQNEYTVETPYQGGIALIKVRDGNINIVNTA